MPIRYCIWKVLAQTARHGLRRIDPHEAWAPISKIPRAGCVKPETCSESVT